MTERLMKKRLIIYFHYDPRGVVDSSCKFSVSALREYGQIYFVTNGVLEPESHRWAEQTCACLLERENRGFDVGAYRDALLAIGCSALDNWDEVVLMNYTLAGPVCSLHTMFETMDVRRDLDFWGLTRHYAMKSRRFGGRSGKVPEHLQSHFLAVRPRMYKDFFAYWQNIRLPESYEASVTIHETQFTRHFSSLGYRWDSYVDTNDLSDAFVNPIMACPRELIEHRNCPFFKRRSFFTPYADELRRTDGQSAGELYRYLKMKTEYPVDTLIADLLPVEPLSAMSQNLHWHYLLAEPAEILPQELTEAELRRGASLEAGKFYFLRVPDSASGAESYYMRSYAPNSETLRSAVCLMQNCPLAGLSGPALPLFPQCAERKFSKWKADLPDLERKMKELGLSVPLDTAQPLELPNGGFLILRAEAFPQGLPPIQTAGDLWLLPLIAQQNGYASVTFETQEQAMARCDVLNAMAAENRGVKAKAVGLARALKHGLNEKLSHKSIAGGK